MPKYAIGLDYGTNSVRSLIVDVATGEEIATYVCNYKHGEAGVVIDPRDPNLARQHPADYVQGAEESVTEAMKIAASHKEFSASDVIGIGVDTTGSTPLPVDRVGKPLAFMPEFASNPAAYAWLWKDHTGHAEAEEINKLAQKMRPNYLAKCGGTYSSEWYWSKVLHCARTALEVFNAAYTWVECADWIPAILTGTDHPDQMKRCICAAGHKAMFNPGWNGYPDEEFIAALDAKLVPLRRTLPDKAYDVSETAGHLTDEWAKKLGLKAGIPVAVGAFDAHLGAVGSGIQPGIFVKTLGTSSCDMAVAPMTKDLPDIPGLCGIVPGSILPGDYGLEAGQSAVGDIFNWYVNYMKPGGAQAGSHEALTKEAEKIKPGESGLLGLDWHNGNRTILVDQRLTGLIVGMTLHTTPAEIYRALMEATAFGARIIIERFEEYGVAIDRVINCGGISVKNPMFMQILADVTGKTMEVSRSAQTCALGSAMAGAVVAGKKAGGYDSFGDAALAMTGVRSEKFVPISANVKIYEQLFKLYKEMHDAFGLANHEAKLGNVMKDLLKIRDEARGRE